LSLKFPSRSRLAILAFVFAVPLAGLVTLDQLIVRATPFWSWVAREFPRRTDDSFRAEAVIRALPSGRDNVILLGNSRADDAIDVARLQERFESRGLRFTNLTVVGSSLMDAAMRAREIAERAPGVVICVTDASSLRPGGWQEETFAYDWRAAASIFPLSDLWVEPAFHISGVAGESNILARHRRSLQNAAWVGLGRMSFLRIRLNLMREARTEPLHAAQHAPPQPKQKSPVILWMKQKEADTYPNVNTRALVWLADTFAAAGTHFVVVEAPLNPLMTAPRVAPKVERFREYVDSLAAEHGFSFVPATRFPELDFPQFKDVIHLNESGRDVYTHALGDALGPLL
jgi:hypothetical protein